MTQYEKSMNTLELPLVYVRKQTRGLGLGSQMVGVTPPSGRLLLVDDARRHSSTRARTSVAHGTTESRMPHDSVSTQV